MAAEELRFPGMYRLVVDGELVDCNLQFIEAVSALKQAFVYGHHQATMERQ